MYQVSFEHPEDHIQYTANKEHSPRHKEGRHPDIGQKYRRLFDLYGRGLKLEVSDWAALIERTAGVSAAFIRELLRKAAVYAAEECGNRELIVREEHLLEALTELLVEGGALTQSLLGATLEPAATSSTHWAGF